MNHEPKTQNPKPKITKNRRKKKKQNKKTNSLNRNANAGAPEGSGREGLHDPAGRERPHERPRLEDHGGEAREREFSIDNLLVRIHFVIEMIRWTGLAPWEFEFPFPFSLHLPY